MLLQSVEPFRVRRALGHDILIARQENQVKDALPDAGRGQVGPSLQGKAPRGGGPGKQNCRVVASGRQGSSAAGEEDSEGDQAVIRIEGVEPVPAEGDRAEAEIVVVAAGNGSTAQ